MANFLPESQLCSNKNISLVKNNCFVNYKLCNYCSRLDLLPWSWPVQIMNSKTKQKFAFFTLAPRVAKENANLTFRQIVGWSTRKRGQVNNTILANSVALLQWHRPQRGTQFGIRQKGFSPVGCFCPRYVFNLFNTTCRRKCPHSVGILLLVLVQWRPLDSSGRA